MNIKERVFIRIPEARDTNLIDELILTATDRLNLLLDTTELPKAFESICVDVVVKLYRRLYFEGIETEKIDTINTQFVKNVLSEYVDEIEAFKTSNNTKVVRFL